MIIKPLYASIDDITAFLYAHQFDREYENMYIDNWFDVIEPKKDTWSQISFAFYTNDGVLAGWIKVGISHPVEVISVYSLVIIDKSLSVPIFRNIEKFLKLRANKVVPKITFKTLVGSKAELIWDKLIKKYNGEIEGISKNCALDQSGDYRDIKSYSIPNPKFIGNKGK